MIIDTFDTDKGVLVIAEIGNNHEGSYALAEEMIGLAFETGANAVKFQTFRAEHLVNRCDQRRFNQLKSFELTFNEFGRLCRVAREAGLLFLSTPFDLESAEFLNTIVPAFKIASGDNNFYPLLETVASFGKPVILSGGLADLVQLRYSKALIEYIWNGRGLQQDVAVLHCVSGYPVPAAEANLSAIRSLKRKLQCTVGYSDHTTGIEAAVLSVALGARIVEKHFTIDKHYSDFRDHQLSASPQEMAQLVKKIGEIVELLGSGTKVMQDCERNIATSVRRSIVAKRDLPAGTVISFEDISWIRPANGLPPGKEHLLLGRVLAKPLCRGEPITLDILSQ